MNFKKSIICFHRDGPQVQIVTSSLHLAFIEVQLEPDHLIVIDTKQAKSTHDEILRQNNIPSDISADLKRHIS